MRVLKDWGEAINRRSNQQHNTVLFLSSDSGYDHFTSLALFSIRSFAHNFIFFHQSLSILIFLPRSPFSIDCFCFSIVIMWRVCALYEFSTWRNFPKHAFQLNNLLSCLLSCDCPPSITTLFFFFLKKTCLKFFITLLNFIP